MWTWIDCQDFNTTSSGIQTVDDWGAAAHRCVAAKPGAKLVYTVDNIGYALQRISIRYRYISEKPATLIIGTPSADPCKVVLQPCKGKEWRWAEACKCSVGSQIEMQFMASGDMCQLDGFFISEVQLQLPERVQDLDQMIGKQEALSSRGYEPVLPGLDLLPSPPLTDTADFIASIAQNEAGESWRVLEKLAEKPCPYILKAFDTPGGTDYNADYVWHLLDKEKLWELPASGLLGVVNPNSDLFLAVGLAVNDNDLKFKLKTKPVLHIADLAVYEVDLQPGLKCEVAFYCHNSDTLLIRVTAKNSTEAYITLSAACIIGKEPEDNPPQQRYVLANQKFGSGVTTTTGSTAWTRSTRDTSFRCYYEWLRGRSRGRRLLSTLVGENASDFDSISNIEAADVDFKNISCNPRQIRLEQGERSSITFALNMRRFSLFDGWNPEVTPELYKRQTEAEAVALSYEACLTALRTKWHDSVRRSLSAYNEFPIISLQEHTWESDFYACLELPRASTFSPMGNLNTPFYNFSRVHAHEPFGWWSYGMHSHESLITLFNNAVAAHLSADYLRGHICHQREDGKLPYGVSHTISPRANTDEATAPLIVWEAWQSYLWSGDRRFLEEAYLAGKKSHQWWLSTRDRCGEGLCHWLNASWESVRDDNSLITWELTGGGQNQEALDLNCYLLKEEQILAEMARELNREDEAETYEQLALHRAKLMNAYMWHKEDQCYYGIGELTPCWANAKDISTFFPLWAGLAPDGRHEPIVELLTDHETFSLPYGPPSLAANEPGFGPEAHWQGANWVEMSLFPLLGLRDYGYYQLAAELAYKNTKMVFDELDKFGHFREYFNSIEGNGVDLIDYIWTAMPAYFVLNIFFGINPTRTALNILPTLPREWKIVTIRNLQLRGKRMSISVSRDNSIKATQVYLNEKKEVALSNRGISVGWNRLAEENDVAIIQPEVISEAHKAPDTAPSDWSEIPPHDYPDEVR